MHVHDNREFGSHVYRAAAEGPAAATGAEVALAGKLGLAPGTPEPAAPVANGLVSLASLAYEGGLDGPPLTAPGGCAVRERL